MKKEQIIVLAVEDKIYALNLYQVERVIHAVEISPLPKAPDIIMGIINYQGSIIPVINMRKLFYLYEREIISTDKLIIANTSKFRLALIADDVEGIIEYNEDELTKPDNIAPGIKFIKGIVKRDDDIVMVYDLDSFIGFDDYQKLSEPIKQE